VLLIIDDLATHAKYAREISLLAGRVPGRESYPADIFYQHSSLVERAGSFNEHYKNGTITLLPTIVTSAENFTNLIPTNVMSMTDGHILFTANLRAQGIYPAIETDRSVTRVGRQTQMFIHKVLSDKIRSLLADYHEMERYGRFGSELSGETQKTIARGKITEELIRQQEQSPIDAPVQILMLTLVFTGFYDTKSIADLREKKGVLYKTLGTVSPYKELCDHMKNVKFDEVVQALTNFLDPLEVAWRTH
jgi:F-type H+-transporting ATPase subunit alpha